MVTKTNLKMINFCNKNKYKYSELQAKVPDNDTDIVLSLPGERKIRLQYRVESETLDVLIDEHVPVFNFEGNDLTPAKQYKKAGAYVRFSKQLVIDLGVAPKAK